MYNPEQLVKAIKTCLTPDLLKPSYREKPWEQGASVYGHCYIASEVFYHLMGGKDAGYTPMQVHHEGASHWWVKGPGGEIWDITKAQFKRPVPYAKSKGRGFLTKLPSRRATELIFRVKGVEREAA